MPITPAGNPFVLVFHLLIHLFVQLLVHADQHQSASQYHLLLQECAFKKIFTLKIIIYNKQEKLIVLISFFCKNAGHIIKASATENNFVDVFKILMYQLIEN